MKDKIKYYVVSTDFSTRIIQARTKKEAVKNFKTQLNGLISNSDKIHIGSKLKLNN